ncbi:hypothetical protein COLO4_13712 [Corchorus olitorius]|uniref:Uncharacterized protein n=1 Tax=Corchorus olitorius TaxID=93759 RepID=A0A1R3JVT7_9ROSI|nr:hypothetical protein COLO4_13712 [Corchorus olitorius]
MRGEPREDEKGQEFVLESERVSACMRVREGSWSERVSLLWFVGDQILEGASLLCNWDKDPKNVAELAREESFLACELPSAF